MNNPKTSTESQMASSVQRLVRRWYWRITWYPDDEEHFGAEEKDFIGTESELQAFADANHPDYLCRLIEFGRRGEAPNVVFSHDANVKKTL